ncbi:MAG: response regulator [Phenylobacterium sp.]|uniref:response regulator transcription factor n=1 Tax=Phenylobacterium sp. TaxID=1871053 RepID=UPI001A57CF1F|nr:response regulator [Phenylobacterium sp.]MBL8770909.1 response regulator [Phenylobacterium sp.]
MDQSLSRPLIVVVDDDLAVRRSLEFALDLEGFAVETYESGEALLLRNAGQTPACLVLDERLPGVSGLGALRQLRARHAETPAILITSHPGPRLREAAASEGVPILEKPLLSETLVAAIQAVAEVPHDLR